MFGLFRRVFGRRERETDMRREFEAHLQTEIDERIASGMSPAEARRTALRDFGSMARIREDARTAWIPRGLDRLRQDLDYGARMLRRNPTLTLVAALSLALGIGANTVVFSIVESVLLQPFPFRDTDRLVFLWQGPDGSSLENQVPGTVLERWQKDSTLLEGLAPYTQTATESAGTGPVRVSRVGHEIFDVLGVRPLIGPGFRPEDQERGPAEVVLSHGFWQLRFGGDPGVIGRTVDLNNGPREIVGVMPPGFFFPEPDVDIWWNIPSMDLAAVSGLAQYLPGFTGEAMTNAQVGSYFGVVRLAPDIFLEQAQAELDVVVARLEEFPDDEPRVARLSPVRETVIGNYRLVLWTLLGAVSLLLLLASSNVASLLLARGMTRQKELAIRGAIGAGPRRLLGQLLTESLLLALVAGVVAAGLAWQGIRLILGMGLVDIPRIETASMNWSVVLFAALVSLVTGVVSGLIPAWRASRTELVGSLNLGHVQALSQAGSGRLRDLLVVSQVAMALILLIGTGLLVNSSVALARIDWGFESDPRQPLYLRDRCGGRQHRRILPARSRRRHGPTDHVPRGRPAIRLGDGRAGVQPPRGPARRPGTGDPPAIGPSPRKAFAASSSPGIP
jgi:predicted permease